MNTNGKFLNRTNIASCYLYFFGITVLKLVFGVFLCSILQYFILGLFYEKQGVLKPLEVVVYEVVNRVEIYTLIALPFIIIGSCWYSYKSMKDSEIESCEDYQVEK